MELLQSQAPLDQELLGSSASAIHGNFDFGLKTSDMGILTLDIRHQIWEF